MAVKVNGVMPNLDQSSNPLLASQIAKLQQLIVWQRWLFIAVMWLTLGWWSLWELRDSLVLLREYFSWAGVIYGFYFHLRGGFGLMVCVILTCSSIIWQISHIFWGSSVREIHQLGVMVEKIQEKGPKHWLWYWIQIK
jgi:hypothetical protein